MHPRLLEVSQNMKRVLVLSIMSLAACTEPPAIETNVSNLISGSLTYSGTSLRSFSLVSPTYSTYSTTGLSGVGPNGTSYSSGASVSSDPSNASADLVGQTLTGTLENGSPAELFVVGAAQGTGAFADLRYYEVEARASVNDPWAPLCPSADGPRLALAVPGRWDTRSGVIGGGRWLPGAPGTHTFACQRSSIAKCIELGYRPNLQGQGDYASLLPACVRLLRADYCGDGTSWTTPGRTIELWDAYGLIPRTMPTWPREAGWTSEGASCLDSARLQYPNASALPSCVRKLSPCRDQNKNWLMMNSFAL
jgi:hypothetical protein